MTPFFSEDAPELAAGLDQTERENEPPPPVLPEYEAIVAQHSDFAGWITIDGTKIDYPVMLTPNDGDYYLKRNVNRGGRYQRNLVYGSENGSGAAQHQYYYLRT